MLHLQQLKYFVTIVEQGSLNKAAAALYISQPALTRQLTNLERSFDTQLLIRTPAGIKLTEAGRYLYGKAYTLLEQARDLEKEMDRYKSIPTKTIRIGALPSLAAHYAPEAIERAQQNGEYSTEILVRDTTRELIGLLEEGHIDIALVQDAPSHPHLQQRILFIDPYFLVLPVDHPLAASAAVSFFDAANEKWVLHQDPCDIRTSFRSYCIRCGIEPAPALELGFNESLLPFVARGSGLSIIPGISAASLHHPGLAVRPFLESNFFRTITVIFHSSMHETVRTLFL